jgi:hypothetical protein
MQSAFQNHWYSFLNRAAFRRCCPSVRTITLQLHAIFIIRTGVRTVLPWRSDGYKSAPHLALSRIASGRVDLSSGRLQLSSHICVCEENPFTCWTLDCVRTCCWDIRTDATLNSSKLLETDGSLDGITTSSEQMLLDWWASGRLTGTSEQKQGIWLHCLEFHTESSWST